MQAYKPWSEPWSVASVVVLPHWFIALVWTTLVLITFTTLQTIWHRIYFFFNKHAHTPTSVHVIVSLKLHSKQKLFLLFILCHVHVCHDRVPVYLSHLSPGWSVGVGGSAAIASSHVVWGVASPAGEGGFARLLITFTSAVSCLPLVSLSITWVVVLVVTWGTPPAWVASIPVPVGRIFAALYRHAAWPSHIGCLGTLQEYIVVKQLWGKWLAARLKHVITLLYYKLDTLYYQQHLYWVNLISFSYFYVALSTWSRWRANLFSFNHIKLHSLSIPYTAEVFPWVILLYRSLGTINKHERSQQAFQWDVRFASV